MTPNLALHRSAADILRSVVSGFSIVPFRSTVIARQSVGRSAAQVEW
jgi:hypothetical protein